MSPSSACWSGLVSHIVYVWFGASSLHFITCFSETSRKMSKVSISNDECSFLHVSSLAIINFNGFPRCLPNRMAHDGKWLAIKVEHSSWLDCRRCESRWQMSQIWIVTAKPIYEQNLIDFNGCNVRWWLSLSLALRFALFPFIIQSKLVILFPAQSNLPSSGEFIQRDNEKHESW